MCEWPVTVEIEVFFEGEGVMVVLDHPAVGVGDAGGAGDCSEVGGGLCW